MRESFEPVPATFYPIHRDGRTENLPVYRSVMTGRLVALGQTGEAYEVQEERLIRQE